MSLYFITGGVRSGKSRFAENLASEKGKDVLYLATGLNIDNEMDIRIEKHQKRRPIQWGLIEESHNLLNTITHYHFYEVILVDCLSTWVTNHLIDVHENQIPDFERTKYILNILEKWLDRVANIDVDIIVVSSETGLGGIAMSSLGRWFQDVLGEVNQLIAEAADEVFAVMSGIPMRLKP